VIGGIEGPKNHGGWERRPAVGPLLQVTLLLAGSNGPRPCPSFLMFQVNFGIRFSPSSYTMNLPAPPGMTDGRPPPFALGRIDDPYTSRRPLVRGLRRTIVVFFRFVEDRVPWGPRGLDGFHLLQGLGVEARAHALRPPER